MLAKIIRIDRSDNENNCVVYIPDRSIRKESLEILIERHGFLNSTMQFSHEKTL